MPPLLKLAADLNAGRIKARHLIEQCLAHIADPGGQGHAAFLKVYEARARLEADAVDALRATGAGLPPFAGIPISIKDLFDVSGDVTTAGSTVLAGRPPASRDALTVQRLRAAGFILIGRTNMTEFAYSGLGINPHYGTPLNPFDRGVGRIPGGSSSGAAVSVTDGMAAAGIGTDTGGSCRVPAALTGIVGLKPTQRRVPLEGVLPLSPTLDSIGPLAGSAACCAVLDAVLSGADAPLEAVPEPFPLKGLRLLAPQSFVLEDLDAPVSATLEHALALLSQRGALIARSTLPELRRLPEINAKGGFSAAESYAAYGDLLEREPPVLDPRVGARIAKGREQSAVDYLRLLQERRVLCARVGTVTAEFDAMVMPTAPIIAPALADLADDAAYFRANGLVLRNPAIANFLDRCSISVPIARAGEAPVGLMLIGEHGADRKLLAVARALEAAFTAQRGLS
jgi:aspartyl-tRNA(Asn)/glutamyl-tRNA(Gln) amidotransferase subunit A